MCLRNVTLSCDYSSKINAGGQITLHSYGAWEALRPLARSETGELLLTFKRERSIAELLILDRPEFGHDFFSPEEHGPGEDDSRVLQNPWTACSEVQETTTTRQTLWIQSAEPIPTVLKGPGTTWRTERWGEDDAELLTVWMLISLTSCGLDRSSLPQDKTNRDYSSLKNYPSNWIEQV